VLVIVASRLDPEARDLAGAWQAFDARILAAEDMHKTGWVLNPDRRSGGRSVIGGAPVNTSEIKMVLTRRPSILAEELIGVHQEDRSYIAAEMNAFLVAWLASLGCPVINRPTGTCLCGPSWTDEHWKIAVIRAGGRWIASKEASCMAYVIGRQCINTPTSRIGNVLLEVAAAAEVQFLGASCTDDGITGIKALPPTSPEAVRAALLEFAGVRP
jgi:hypothetical protein